MNLMKLCIGTPDYTNVPWYSYDDIGNGQVDANLGHFSVEKDLAHVIPVMKIARKKNPDLLFFASHLMDG
jgi:glucosylceramidase